MMMDSDDKVTIAIPTLNRADYLRLAIGSALAQSYGNIEIIVSNNASTDHTASVLAEMADPRLRVLVQDSTVSMMENWNICLQHATGKYFLLLSDDDILEPDAIEQMLGPFHASERAGDKIAFVWCAAETIDSQGNPLAVKPEPTPPETALELLRMYFECRHDVRMYPCATLFRRSDLEPGYDLRYPLAADTAQWIGAIIQYGRARHISRKLVRYRLHQNTTLKTQPVVWCDEYKRLSEFVLAKLVAKHLADPGYLRGLAALSTRRNVRLTIGMIKIAHRDHKARALREYARNMHLFLSPFGAFSLAKAILILFLPRTLEAWIRQALGRRKTVTSQQLA